jgi:hypothetical protein
MRPSTGGRTTRYIHRTIFDTSNDTIVNAPDTVLRRLAAATLRMVAQPLACTLAIAFSSYLSQLLVCIRHRLTIHSSFNSLW